MACPVLLVAVAPILGYNLFGRFVLFRKNARGRLQKARAMDEGELLPPGRHPFDPSKEDIDPIGFALERIQTFLLWIEEHRASFEKYRNTDPGSAESELRNLENSSDQAMAHLQRLKELLLAGHSINPNKRLPKGLNGPDGPISAMIKRLRQA